MTDEYSLINLRRIKIIRHPKLQISKNSFMHETYFMKRKMQLKSLFAARNGEEMLEPYERVRQEVASSCNNISAELSAVLVVKTFPSETASEVILGWVA